MRMFLALESIVETIAFLENLFAIRLLRASAEWGGARRRPTRFGFVGQARATPFRTTVLLFLSNHDKQSPLTSDREHPGQLPGDMFEG